MLITRTPLRISIGGGGTDLASYYSRHGGFVISAAIGAIITLFTGRSALFSGSRQLALGFAAAGLTFAIGKAIGVAVAG